MKTFRLSLLALCVLTVSLLAEQISQVTLVDLRPLPGWKGDPVGNVAITTAEGKHLQLKEERCAQQPKVSKGGLIGWVGWVDCSKPGEPETIRMVKGVPIGSRLVLRRPDGSLLTISAGKPIIEEWGFDPDNIHVVLKSRALHGPAVIERFTIKNGSKAAACSAYESTAPAWAKPYLDR